MTELHHRIQTRQWNTVRRAIRLDTSVAMRIDDSNAEEDWVSRARMAAWRRGGGMTTTTTMMCSSSSTYEREVWNDVPREPRMDVTNPEEESFPVRYWVPPATTSQNPSFLRQRRTLLHAICKLKFYSKEALIVQLSSGDDEDLRDLTNAIKTMEMLIDASHNELRPLTVEEDYYHELEERTNDGDVDIMLVQSLSSTCPNCSCYYHSQYCPPMGLDPVERYNDDDEAAEEEYPPSKTKDTSTKVLHESVLTMTDALGATPLHLLTGEGSAHEDIVRLFLDKCRGWDMDAMHEEHSRRPTLYALVSAQNCHGCTPLHFLSGKMAVSYGTNDEVLRLILDRFEKDNIINNNQSCSLDDIPSLPIHPLLIPDGDGDLPLHYASSIGASPPLLSILTKYPTTHRAALVRNAEGRLPIDELIIWYKELMAEEHEESEDESDSNGENDGYNHEDDSSGSNDVLQREEVGNEQTQHSESSPEELVSRALRSIMLSNTIDGMESTQLSLSPHFQNHLWDRMWVLIQAGANAIASASIGTTAFHLSPGGPPWNPIPASIIVTKYSDFPALVLVASILMTTANVVASNTEVPCEKAQLISKALLQEDSFGLLPLHWACGDIAYLLSSSSSDTKVYDFPNSEQHLVSTCRETVRWNTPQLPCSMIRYLLHLCPESARVPTRNGRLPLHLFLDGGYRKSLDKTCSWGDVTELLKACPDALRTPDVCSHMYPFQVAAAVETSIFHVEGERCVARTEVHDEEGARLKSLEITYLLIMEDPSLCRFFFDNRHREP
ncbi:hypothetical protein HJC23_001275 [Cyclotella cryptica]|uniref:Uncharacterized protein n=1 Tax=Cyclotella cryptica TaxID=29204 RepID=A0ABD3PEQ2_9STRA